MKILQVIHQYPPYSSQGSEVYCRSLALQLQQACDIAVFHVSVDRKTWRKQLRNETDNRISVFHCVDQGHFQRLANWANPFLQRSFQHTLNEVRPDVVHFHNYVSLGDDLVVMARNSGAKIVYTLHDYGLICPNPLLLTVEGKLCSKSGDQFCPDCCMGLLRSSSGPLDMPARRLPSLSRWRALAGQLSFVPAKLALTAGVRFVEWLTGEFSQPVLKTKQQFFRDATERILQNTDLFLAPSLFLKEKFLSCGLRPEKIRHLPYGICRFPPGNKVPRQQKLRIGYLGALHAHKGLEVLLAAFQGLNDTAELHIHGNTFGSPVSEQYWKRVRQQPDSGVIVHGPYRNEQLPDILTTLDVVVVPSLWYENAPLTIQEALLAKVPVVTSDCGGMAEMIQHEVNGLLFPMGDSRGLHNALQRLIQEDGLLSKLQSEIRNVLLIEHQAREVLAVYQKLCQTTEDTCTPSDGDRSCLLQDSTANVSASTSGAAHEARQMQQETSAGLNSRASKVLLGVS